MRTIWLRLQAPFAAFRWMQAGTFRGTSPVIPPSAAWGLVLNLAGVETRGGGELTTLIRPDAPPLRLATGSLAEPGAGVIYQQLHEYPVGNSGKELEARAHGQKFWIKPVRRQLLVGFDAALGVMSEDGALLDRVGAGLSGHLDAPRYGLPFAGENDLLFSRIDVLSEPPPARWYVPCDEASRPVEGSCRLTVSIDRADSSRTRSRLFAPGPAPTGAPPEDAWVWTPSQP